MIGAEDCECHYQKRSAFFHVLIRNYALLTWEKVDHNDVTSERVRKHGKRRDGYYTPNSDNSVNN